MVCRNVSAGVARGAAAGASVGGASLTRWSFLGRGALPQGMSLTRWTGGGVVDANGAYASVGVNAPRFDGVMGTGAARGLLVEENRTNSVRYSGNDGAVVGPVGSGGALPTNWSVAAANGLAVSVVGVGTERGLPYVDVRLVGTSTGTEAVLAMEDANGILAAASQSWTGSVHVRVSGGSRAHTTGYAVRLVRDGGTTLATGANGFDAVGSDVQARLVASVGSTPAGVSRIWPLLVVTTTASASVDVTLRVGGLQLERGATASSYIACTGASTTRAADVVTLDPTSWLNATEGTVAACGVAAGVASANGVLLNLSDGSTDNRMTLRGVGSGNIGRGSVVAGGVTQANMDFGSVWQAGVPLKMALSYGPNAFACCANGQPVQTDSSGSVPPMTQGGVGKIGSSDFWNGWLQWVAAAPVRVDAGALAALTE